MTDDNLRQDIEELEAQGWQADTAPRAIEKHHQFPSFNDTLSFLMELGDAAERFGTMPSIRIEGGNDVWVRLGREPAPALTAEEIALAQALAQALSQA